jgi:hypothetical protein
MKIVSGNEPLFCDESDDSFMVMTTIASTTNDAELIDSVRRSMPLKFEAMVRGLYMYSFLLPFSVKLTVALMSLCHAGAAGRLEDSAEQAGPENV